MKKIASVILAAFMALIPSLLSDCDFDPEPQGVPVYFIGAECNIGNYSLRVDIDHLNERFVAEYKELGYDGYKNAFNFKLRPSTRGGVSISDEFEYTDELGSEIEFNEYGDYDFEGSKTFYVSYKNASALVKDVIIRNQYSLTVFDIDLHFWYNHWISEASNVDMWIDKESERFVVQYEITNAEADHYLDFQFNYGNKVTSYNYGEWVRNSEEFEYTDELGEKIEFGENGYYVFDTDKAIYISYANASEEIKTAISEENYSVVLPSAQFYSNYLKKHILQTN